MTDSKSLREMIGPGDGFDRTLDNSRAVRALRAPFEEGSRPVAAAHWLSGVVRSSYIFRWLTAEPEPDIIVIDLRETMTVGPFIALLDRLVPHATRMWEESTSKAALARATSAFHAGPIQWISAFVLGILLAQLILTWGSVSTASLVVRLFLVAIALVGLRVSWTWDELRASKACQLVAQLLAPPEPPDEGTR